MIGRDFCFSISLGVVNNLNIKAMAQNAQYAKEKFAGTHVTNLGNGNIVLVDAENNQPLVDEIQDDELVIPSGYIVILKDGDDTTVKIGLGKVWSESVTISEPAPPEGPEDPDA